MILLLLASVWSRFVSPPLTGADFALAAGLEAELAAKGADAPILGETDRVPGRFTVGFKPGFGEPVADWLRREGMEVVGVRTDFIVARAGGDDAATADCTADRLMAAAAGVPGVSYAEPSYYTRAARIPNDPQFLARQWDKWVCYADKAWDITTGSSAVRVAVVDNGVDYTHPDLAENFVTGDLGYDFVSNDADPRPDNPANPEAFHGTHVAGIIGAGIDNARGIAGWSRCQLLAVRVLNDSGSGYTDDLAEGIRWAADHNCRIVNMSLTAASAPTVVVNACTYAANNNVLLIAASGNEGSGSIGYPANLSTVVAVGALGQDSRIANYSNFGPGQEIIAPGSTVFSTSPAGGYVVASGTSMASPQVAGVAALVYAANAGMNAARVRALLSAAAVDMGTPGRDSYHGYGLLNAFRAAEMARTGLKAAVAAESGSGSAIARSPVWLEPGAAAYDAQGRLAAIGSGSAVRLTPGAWFVRKDSGTQRVVVLR